MTIARDTVFTRAAYSVSLGCDSSFDNRVWNCSSVIMRRGRFGFRRFDFRWELGTVTLLFAKR
jgi:hypothetical protein